MGKKRVIKKGVSETTPSETTAPVKTSKRKLDQAVIYIEATYNNTRVSITDPSGGVVAWSTSGGLGFQGAKKGTPFAAGKVGELMAAKALAMGIKEVSVVVRGVGAGREAALRAFAAHHIVINSITDTTPVPFNGPKPKKSRRV